MPRDFEYRREVRIRENIGLVLLWGSLLYAIWHQYGGM